MNAQDPLAQLQDIHLPAPIGVWPLAWGWWALLIIVLLAMTGIFFWLRTKIIRNAYRNLALKELRQIQKQFNQQQSTEHLQAINQLLRRCALSGFGNTFDAGLQGAQWLQWLDNQAAKPQIDFTMGDGNVLAAGPYQKNPAFNPDHLHKIVSRWISSHKNQWQQKKQNTSTTAGEPTHA